MPATCWRSSSSRPGSYIGTSPRCEHLDLLGDDVEAQHLEAQLGHGRGVGGAEVAGADHGDLEGHGCSRSVRSQMR